MEAGRGEPQTSTARPAAQPRAGPEPAKAPDGGRREEAAARSGGRRSEGGRPAPRLPGGWTRAAGRAAGRARGEVSSCFPGCAAARGLGRWPPARETVFLRLKASPLPPGGARRCGRVEAGGGPHPRCPPRRNPPRWAPSRGPSPGPAAGPPDSSGRGGAGRGAGLDRCPPHRSGKPRLARRSSDAQVPRGGESRCGWSPGLSPAALAHVGVLSPRHLSAVLAHSLWPGAQ